LLNRFSTLRIVTLAAAMQRLAGQWRRRRTRTDFACQCRDWHIY
jgi:hypothetical protein